MCAIVLSQAEILIGLWQLGSQNVQTGSHVSAERRSSLGVESDREGSRRSARPLGDENGTIRRTQPNVHLTAVRMADPESLPLCKQN